jgi:fermentation-respiration switch protein FrsA (DUF1100 family)
MAGNIISSMAFIPPRPSSYDESALGLTMLACGVPCWSYPVALPHEVTILYSHGNAEDLGISRSYLVHLSEQLKVNIVTYDYEGYGINLGPPSEAGCYRSIEAVYTYLIGTMSLRTSKIIIMGRSLGSGPSVHLALKYPCAGLILISPLTSAIRVVSEWAAILLAYSDIFLNLYKMPKVTCPVLVIHGIQDDVVPWRHGDAIAKAAPNLWRMVSVPSGTHNNRATIQEAVCDIREFIASVH